MAQTKPTKPTNLMPRHFADDGVKNNFSSAKIASGFSSNFEDILQGDNLNYMLDTIGKELQYLTSVVDFIVDMPINKTLKVNANNNLEYVNLVEDVSDKANISLSNLNATGQALINNKANIDLSNLSTTGQTKIQPIGQPQLTLSNVLPTNCIWYEGAEVSRTTYANLFAMFGTTYGAGNGSTTFNLPDCRNRVFWGAQDFGYISAGLPNITGSFVTRPNNNPSGDGAFYSTWSQESEGVETGGGGYRPQGRGVTYLNASRSSSIYGNSSTVQPPAIKVRVYARYQ